DETGDGMRRVLLGAHEGFTIRLDASPAGPSPARYALYAYVGEPNETNFFRLPRRVGTMCFYFPDFTRTIVLANTLGRFGTLGTPQSPGRAPAPVTILDRTRGVSSAVTFTVQGFIADNGSLSSRRLSVTNSVTVWIQ